MIWGAIRKAGLIKEKDVAQLYDPVAGTFLADRFVRGTCPKCGAQDQPGDNCSSCGAAYTPADLKNPKSTLSGAVPETRTAEHLFIELEQLHEFLNEWTQDGTHLQSEVANYLKGHFLGESLRDWDVSRPDSRFRTNPVITGTYGLMRRLATWHRRWNGATEMATNSPIGGTRNPVLRFIILSGRTSRTSTRFSGLAC